MSIQDFDYVEVDFVERLEPKNPILISYGLILFNQEGKILTIRRSSTYGFSSIFNMLLLKETTATRPDEFIRICRELVEECSPGELRLLKDYWTPEGFDNLLDLYLKRLPQDHLRQKLRNLFRCNAFQVKYLWGILLNSVKISQVTPGENYRIHDIPKGRDCSTFEQIKHHVKYETGLTLPRKLTMGDWHDISYVCNTGIEYNLRLVSVKCENMLLMDSKLQWCSLDQVKMHPAISKEIKVSARDF